MLHWLEQISDRGPDPLGWAVRRDQLRVLVLEVPELTDQLVVPGIGHDRVVEDVVAMVVVANLVAQLSDSLCGVRHLGTDVNDGVSQNRL